MLVISALGRVRQEDCCEFEASLGYTFEFNVSLNNKGRPCLKKKRKKTGILRSEVKNLSQILSAGGT